MKKFAAALVVLGLVTAFGLTFHFNGKVSAQEPGPGPLYITGTTQ